jgi:hypothetical protein
MGREAALIIRRHSPYIQDSSRNCEDGMVPRVIKLREQTETAGDVEQVRFSQNKRPELGRFLLQVDRQTKGSYQTLEAAEEKGKAIKKSHPILHVAVYDSVESQNKLIEA